MRALVYTRYGGPEVLEVAEVPPPHAGPGQVRITVRAAGVNPYDWKTFGGAFSGGQALATPGLLGNEAAGHVDEVGEGVGGVAVGDEVFGRGQGVIAQQAVLSSWAVKPPGVDWAVAAGAATAGETAERGLRLLGVDAGRTVFVDGASGGVGSAAVQLAVARKATVIASGGDGNLDYLRELGAIPVRHGEGVADRVRSAAGGPVDAVFDVAGRTPAEELVSLVRDPAQMLSISNFEVTRVGARVSSGGADSRPMQALALVAELLEARRLNFPVRTFPLDDAPEAYRISMGGHVRGKLVLLP